MAGFDTLVKIPYIGAPKYIKQFLMEIKDIKREIDSNTVIVGDFDMNGWIFKTGSKNENSGLQWHTMPDKFN